MIEPKKIKKKVVSRRKPPEAVVHSTYIDGLNERVRLRKRGGQPEASLRTRSEETTRIPPPLHPPPPNRPGCDSRTAGEYVHAIYMPSAYVHMLRLRSSALGTCPSPRRAAHTILRNRQPEDVRTCACTLPRSAGARHASPGLGHGWSTYPVVATLVSSCLVRPTPESRGSSMSTTTFKLQAASTESEQTNTTYNIHTTYIQQTYTWKMEPEKTPHATNTETP